MSYLVLARKWRPRTFSDLIGQETISHILSNAISKGKIAHAYLFSGPRGVGKTSSARILARAVNCEKGPIPEPCGTCQSCIEILEGSSVDVMEIDGASNNSVNDIRDLRERVRYAPASGRYKVYIIDEAHMLSDAAFNALLKTLEEPPPHVIFILATTAPRKIPATVLSRCQHLPFRRIPIQKIKGRLRLIADSEGVRISDESLEMIARAAEGSMRDSLTILDQVISFSPDIKDSDIKDLLGIPDFNALYEIALSIIKGDRKRVLEVIQELTDKGTDLKSFAKDLMNFFRDLLTAKVTGSAEDVLDLSEGEIGMIKELTSMSSEESLTILLGEMIRAEQDVRTAFSPRVVLEMALIKASYLSNLKPLQEAIDNIGLLLDAAGKGDHEGLSAEDQKEIRSECNRQSVEIPNIPTPEVPLQGINITTDNSTEACETEEIPTVEKSDEWSDILKGIDETNHPLFCKLSEAEIEITGNVIHIRFNGGLSVHADSVKKNKKFIEEIASKVMNKKVSIKVETSEKKVPSRRDIKERILNEPLVKEAIELFGGRVVDIIENKRNGG
ncbi:MAG: DNA polymerase III subunit gamma/tau [Thermodesulfovibrionales bacterium]